MAVEGKLEYKTSTIAFGLLGIYITQYGLTTGQVACSELAGEVVAQKLRKQVFEKIVRQDTKYFDFNRTGDLANRLTSDIFLVKSNFTSNFDDGLYGFVFVLGATFMLFNIAPSLAAISLSVYPAAIGINYLLGSRLSRLQNDLQKILGRANDVSTEVISEMTVVRQFGAQSREIQRYGSVIDKSFQVGKKMAVTNAFYDAFAEFGGNMAQLLVLVYGVKLTMDGVISVGELTSFLIYSFSLATYFTDVTTFGASFMKGLGAAKRVLNVLDQQEQIDVAQGKKLDSVSGLVEFNDVSFSYPLRPSSRILNQFQLRLDPGTSIALVGPSGCGKCKPILRSLVDSFQLPLLVC